MFAEIGLLVLEGDAAGLAAKVSELAAARPAPPALESPENGTGEANGSEPDVVHREAPAPLVHSPHS